MLWLYVSAFHKCERERAQIHTFKTKQQRKKLVHLSLDITWHRLIYVANWNIWCVFHMNSPAEIKNLKPLPTKRLIVQLKTFRLTWRTCYTFACSVFSFRFRFCNVHISILVTDMYTHDWHTRSTDVCMINVTVFFQISFTGRISAVQCSFHRNHIFTAKRVYWTHDWLYVFI